jgi:hypothetical protein
VVGGGHALTPARKLALDTLELSAHLPEIGEARFGLLLDSPSDDVSQVGRQARINLRQPRGCRRSKLLEDLQWIIP